MARNMKMELLTFSLILYQSKNCGHRIHVLFMMYDVYWYCQMKKNEWLWTFWKRNDLYEHFEKRGGVEKRGRRKRNTCPMRLWYKLTNHAYMFETSHQHLIRISSFLWWYSTLLTNVYLTYDIFRGTGNPYLVEYKWAIYARRSGVRVVVLNATFNNISVVSWQSVLLVGKGEYQEKPLTYRRSETNFITYCCIERDSNSQR
jgi:hypothetical protein